jgi:ectoine hydroxylase-related dioxygenase (phytanoyl-CoA dioxygenase family)
MRILLIAMLFALRLSINAEEQPIQWQEQKAFLETNGYVWIKNFFSPEQVRLLRNWTDAIKQDTDILLQLPAEKGNSLAGTLIIVPEAKNPQQACRAEDFCSVYPDLHHFIRGTVTAYIAYLLGEPYTLFKDKINFKWPGGGAFLPHQDFPAYDNFGPREHVTAMISIDPATLENGCLQIAQNWQEGRKVLPFIIGGPAHGSIEPAITENISWLKLETSPGDLVLFNSYIPHYSEANHSSKPRRAMFLTHNKLKEGDHRAAYYHAKRSDPLNPVFHIGTPTKARDK